LGSKSAGQVARDVLEFLQLAGLEGLIVVA